jgi:hypothetical protein
VIIAQRDSYSFVGASIPVAPPCVCTKYVVQRVLCNEPCLQALASPMIAPKSKSSYSKYLTLRSPDLPRVLPTISALMYVPAAQYWEHSALVSGAKNYLPTSIAYTYIPLFIQQTNREEDF